MQTENRAAAEVLQAATEALAANAAAKRYPSDTVADGLFRAAVALHMMQFGVAPTRQARPMANLTLFSYKLGNRLCYRLHTRECSILRPNPAR